MHPRIIAVVPRRWSAVLVVHDRVVLFGEVRQRVCSNLRIAFNCVVALVELTFLLALEVRHGIVAPRTVRSVHNLVM